MCIGGVAEATGIPFKSEQICIYIYIITHVCIIIYMYIYIPVYIYK
jgi:hypothetical protein